MNKKWTQEEINLLVEKFPITPTSELVSLFYNRTYGGIRVKANKLNIKKIQGLFNDKRPNKNKYSCISSLLEDTLESYYWIGFLIADGYFSKTNRLSLCLSKLDIEHLYKFVKFIKYSGDIYEYPYNNKEYCKVSIMDNVLVQAIKNKFSISNKKTYEPCNINIINDDFFISFLIGFIDGDGYIKKQHNRLDSLIYIKLHSSWLDNLFIIKNKLCSIYNKNMNNPALNKAGYSKFCIGNNFIQKELKKFAIDNNLPILIRKWDRIVI